MSSDIKPSHVGRLHRALHVAAGQKIPITKIKKAERSKSPKLRAEAQYADNVRKR